MVVQIRDEIGLALRIPTIVPQVPPLERIVTEIVALALGAVVMDAGHGQVDTHELVKARQVPSGSLVDGSMHRGPGTSAVPRSPCRARAGGTVPARASSSSLFTVAIWEAL